MFHATFIEENNEFKAQLVHEQVDEITAEGTRQKGAVETAGAEQVAAVTAEGNAQMNAITNYCEGQQEIINQKVSTADSAKDDAVTAKEQAEMAQSAAETAAATATQKAAEAGEHDILTQTSLTDVQKATARTNINAAKPDGVYEPIETITLTEDTASVVRTQEPDGTPYNFVAINSIVEFAIGAGNGQVYFVCMNGSKEIMAIERPNCITPSSKRYVQGKCELIHGAWFSQLLSPNNGMLANSTAFTNPMSQGGFFASDYPAITAFKLASATSEVPIPAGTIISIYGVRA